MLMNCAIFLVKLSLGKTDGAYAALFVGFMRKWPRLGLTHLGMQAAAT
jgi:hypothetical protein